MGLLFSITVGPADALWGLLFSIAIDPADRSALLFPFIDIAQAGNDNYLLSSVRIDPADH